MTSSVSVHKISIWAAIALVIDFQLGSGFFLTPSQIAPMGRWGLVGWLGSGLGAMALCHVFSVLSFWNTDEGGPAVYVEGAFGRRFAFYTAWSYWVVGWISSLPLIWLATTSLQDFWGPFSAIGVVACNACIVAIATVLNMQGVAFTGGVAILFSVLKIVPMIAIPLVCWASAHIQPWHIPSDIPTIDALSRSTLSTFWGFLGIEAGTTVIQNVRNPKRSIPLALFAGTVLVLVLYVFGTSMVMASVPKDIVAQSTNAYTVLLSRAFGPGWSKIVSLVVFVVCTATVSTWLLVSGQVGSIAAKRKLFPGFFAQTNARGAPVASVMITACLLMAMVFIGGRASVRVLLEHFIDLSVGLFILTYAVSVASLVRLIMRKQVPSSMLLWMSIAVASLFCVWIMMSMTGVSFAVMMSVPAIGGIVARLFKWPVF